MNGHITTLGFDADDTLWHNENLFEEHHRKFCELLSEYHDSDTVEKTLYKTEMNNLELFGYGVKGFTLSCIETAIALTDGDIEAEEIRRIIDSCRTMLNHPVDLIDGVAPTIESLSKRYRLIIITKGDLRDQERKIAKSGIAHCFDHIEVLSDKLVENYDRVLRRNQIRPANFMMIGNSLRSDILPVLHLDGFATHIPYHLTWTHERVDRSPDEHEKFFQLESVRQLPELLDAIDSD